MKKIVCILTTLLMLCVLAACNGTQTISGTSLAEKAESVESNASSESNTAGLEREIETLNYQLLEAEKEKAELEQQLDALNNRGKVTQTIFVKNKVYLTVTEDYSPTDANRQPYTVLIEYEDGTIVEVLNHRYIWTVKPSPDGTKVIMNDFEMEIDATVFLYDVEKRETKELSMPNLPANRTAAYMEWIDNRYFLFTVQDDNGTVVRGGDVYIYDTQTDEYKPIVKNSDAKFQTVSFTVCNLTPKQFDTSFVMFNSALYEDTMNFTGNVHQILTVEEIFAILESGNAIDLSTAKKDNLTLEYN